MLSYKEYKKLYFNNNGGIKGYLNYILIKPLKKILKIPYHTYMCIKYPFLYPRNRWDGKHHAYMLNNLRYKLWNKAINEIHITGKVLSEIPEQKSVHISNGDFDALLTDDKQMIMIINNVEIQKVQTDKIVWGDKFEIIDINLGNNKFGNQNVVIGIKVKDPSDKNNYGFYSHTVNLIKNKFYYDLYKITKWIDEKILDNIFILPTYNEWEAVEPGWNKAFGKQFLKELKQQLIKDKMLYKWRITDIKEKWGMLQLYCNYGSKELYQIIRKYENLSWNYCIHCGKPTEVISTGWISPYCKECAEKNHLKYVEKEKWNSYEY
jgi:hypothetical protein